MQPCLHGRQRELEQFGGLLATEALEVAQHDDLAFPGGEPVERAADQVPSRLARGRHRLQLLAPPGVESQLIDRFQALRLIGPPAAKAARRMARDGEQPRPGRALATIARGVPPRGQEGFLQGVLGVRRLSQERGQVAVDGGLVRGDEPGEGPVVAGGAPFEERRVGLAQRALAGQVLNPNTV